MFHDIAICSIATTFVVLLQHLVIVEMFFPISFLYSDNLQAILTKLVSKVDSNRCPTSNQINVCRENILNGSMQAFKRRPFDPSGKLDIIFVDMEGVSEGAVDEGGPSREYFRLLMKAIQHAKIFEGPEQCRQLTLDTHGKYLKHLLLAL